MTTTISCGIQGLTAITMVTLPSEVHFLSSLLWKRLQPEL